MLADFYTLPSANPVPANPGTTVQDANLNVPVTATDGNPKGLAYVFALLLGLLIVAGYAQQKANDGKPDPRFGGINVYTFLSVGLMAMVFSLSGKILTTRYKVPYLTDLFRAA